MITRRMMLLFIFPLAACSDYYPTRVTDPPVTYDTAQAKRVHNLAAQWTSEHAWHIDSMPALVIQPTAASAEYAADPRTMFRNAAGELIVTDGATPQLFVYGRNGAFLRRTPACNAQSVKWAQPYRGDSIAVYAGSMNVSILTPDAQCGREVKIAIPAANDANMAGDTLWAGDMVLVYPDGSFAASSFGTVAEPEKRGATWYTMQLYRATPEGAIADTLGTYPGGEVFWARNRARPLEFGRRLHAAIDGFTIVAGEPSLFRYLRIDTTGTVRLVGSRASTAANVTDQDHVTVATFGNPANPDTQELLEARKWPTKKPAYSALLTDPDGNAWFEEYRFGVENEVPADPPTIFWSVFNREGAWLGQVEVPGRLLVRRIYNDMVIGVWVDENGTRGIRGYRLTRPDVPDEEYELVNVRRGVR